MILLRLAQDLIIVSWLSTCRLKHVSGQRGHHLPVCGAAWAGWDVLVKISFLGPSVLAEFLVFIFN